MSPRTRPQRSGPRNERKAPAPRSPRERPSSGPPRITSVTIPWSENSAVPLREFGSLWDADRALYVAFRREPPPAGGAYDKTGFLVRWSDGATHEGRVDVSQRALERAPDRGGLLRSHLLDVAAWYGSDDFVRMFTGSKSGEEIAADLAWGKQLAARLAHDLAAQLVGNPRRNRVGGRSP